MKVGPIKNPFSPDCAPLMLDVDEKWLADQAAAHPNMSLEAIIAEELVTGVDRALRAEGKRVQEAIKAIRDTDNGE